MCIVQMRRTEKSCFGRFAERRLKRICVKTISRGTEQFLTAQYIYFFVDCQMLIEAHFPSSLPTGIINAKRRLDCCDQKKSRRFCFAFCHQKSVFERHLLAVIVLRAE